MQTEASDAGATWTGQRVDSFPVNPIAGGRHVAPSLGAKCRSPRYRGRLQLGEPRLVTRQWIGFLRIAAGSQPAPLEKFPNTLGEGSGHSLDFFILGRKQRSKLRCAIIIGGIDQRLSPPYGNGD